MKTIEIKKLNKVTIPESELKNYVDIIAFQMVEFTINFFGHIESFCLDTKILNNGKQVVIDGNGFISSGYEIY